MITLKWLPYLQQSIDFVVAFCDKNRWSAWPWPTAVVVEVLASKLSSQVFVGEVEEM